jgi:hypothetical protein
MTNVVQFGKTPEEPNDEVWTCAHCGSQNFFLYRDGRTECSLCHGMGDDAEGGWLENLNEADDFDKDIAPRQNVDHGTVDFARAAVVKSIDEHTVAVAVLWPTGRIKMRSVFSEADAPERKSWLKTTLAAAAGLALGERADTGDLPE